jgi:hypothetical protein
VGGGNVTKNSVGVAIADHLTDSERHRHFDGVSIAKATNLVQVTAGRLSAPPAARTGGAVVHLLVRVHVVSSGVCLRVSHNRSQRGNSREAQ